MRAETIHTRYSERGPRGGKPQGPQPAYQRHCWLLPPLQSHISILAPFVVDAPVTSRHSPDWTPTMVPSALNRHCWLVPPVQSQMTAVAPRVVAPPNTSMHLLP